uniref:Uncharacterized protein n=1 Tax=Dulem virus 36 TaxID=3145754 RepID=A0AAU8AYC8_9CAUD
MSKYCKPMGLYVTYLDCIDCEDKECMQKNKKVKLQYGHYFKAVAESGTSYYLYCGKHKGKRLLYNTTTSKYELVPDSWAKGKQISIEKNVNGKTKLINVANVRRKFYLYFEKEGAEKCMNT